MRNVKPFASLFTCHHAFFFRITKNTREAQKEADKKAGEILFEKPAKNEKDPKKKEVLERLSEQSKKRAETNAYKDKGWLGYSWEDLFEDTWGTVKGWFK
ncbi:hypothetical protein N3930_11955 [Bacillus thuringiensis]|nr:hypothetical protein [Bacillus thuringiensis]